MNKTLAAAFTLALLSACSSEPLTWYREGASPEHIRRDEITCEQQARIRAPAIGSPTGRGLDAGSASGVGDALNNAAAQTGATRDCMRDKGYILR
jgi:hypothetical protein